MVGESALDSYILLEFHLGVGGYRGKVGVRGRKREGEKKGEKAGWGVGI